MPTTVLLVLSGLCWLAGWMILFRVPRCRAGRGRTGVERVSVIVPARNEADNLPALLASLTAQSPLPHDILVVDDHSEDRTADVARDHGATVVPSEPPPEGWLGKPWACQQGAARATGGVLVFVDADFRVEPGGLARLTDTLASEPGIVSVTPYHRVAAWHEQGSAFFNVMQAAGLAGFTVWGRRIRPAGLFGPCVAVRRHDYDGLGGHKRVRGELLEHVALGRHAAAQGVRLRLYGGRGTVGVRMYPRGWREAAAGWGKSFARGAAGTPPWVMALLVAWMSGLCAAAFAGPLSWLLLDTWPALEWSVLYVLFALQVFAHLRRLGSFRFLTALVYPIPLFFFFGVFSKSVARTRRRGEVHWKGRVIRTRDREGHRQGDSHGRP